MGFSLFLNSCGGEVISIETPTIYKKQKLFWDNWWRKDNSSQVSHCPLQGALLTADFSCRLYPTVLAIDFF